MTIAVNTRFLMTTDPEGYSDLLYEYFRRITKTNAGHDFIFIYDRPYKRNFVFEKNVKTIVAGPAASNYLLQKYWYDVRIPAILKKYKADLFVSFDGKCSLTTRLPQCLVLSRTDYSPRFLNKAKSIVTTSSFLKQDIVDRHHIDPGKITVIPVAAKELFHPLNDEEKTAIKNEFTGGREYFIYVGPLQPHPGLQNLLKAFSIFKKRQMSNWKLVLTGRPGCNYKTLAESLKTYKYRDDVVLTGYRKDEELVGILGSAYALVYPGVDAGPAMPVLEAMRSHVPIITFTDPSIQEMAGEAALYVDSSSHEDIADKMMRLYKDENLRGRLIEKGKQAGNQFDWDISAKFLWQCISRAAGER